MRLCLASPSVERGGRPYIWCQKPFTASLILRDALIEPPIVGYELMKGNKIVAEAELAWEDDKVAVAYSDQIEALRRNGWNVLACQSVIDDPTVLIKAFR